MKLITRDSDYAIRALCYMAKNSGRVCCVTELTSELRIPRAFLRKLLQALTRSGYLSSYKGKGGGFKLRKKPHAIGLMGIIRIFQGGVDFDSCFLRKKICPERAQCPLRKKIIKIGKDVTAELQQITIAQLIV